MKDILPRTRLIYEVRQAAFLDWCRGRKIRQPATHDQVGEYLDELRQAGFTPSQLQTVLSSLGRMYRESYDALDTKHPAISSVLHDPADVGEPVAWWREREADVGEA